MAKYKYTAPYTVRGYNRAESGTLTIIDIPVVNGRPCDAGGYPLKADGEIVDLMGWPDEQAASYNDGAILVAIQSL